MSREDVGQLALAAALTATAGWVDAVGFLALGGVFVSFMSGDTTRLAVAAAGRDAARGPEMAGLIALFVAGVALGRILARAAPARRRPTVLAAETALLVAAMATPDPWLSRAAMVLAMGVQNAVLHRAGDTTTSLTYVTGTLVRFSERLVDAVWPGAGRHRWGWAPYLLQWGALLAGATAGALVFARLGLSALALPALLLAILAAATLGAEPPGHSF